MVDYKQIEEHRRRIGEGNKGKKRSEETKQILREKAIEQFKNPKYGQDHSKRMKGRIPWNKGKKTGPLTENHKIKLSNSLKDRFLKEESSQWIGGHTGYLSKEMRKVYKECFLCKSSYDLVMHHIDENHKNNDRSNRIIICRKCHGFWHTH